MIEVTRRENNYAINFPLTDGMDDDSYSYIFEPTIDEIFTRFKPEAVLVQ
jgi:acetoin utilization deacetylase AcuC-like enzyme